MPSQAPKVLKVIFGTVMATGLILSGIAFTLTQVPSVRASAFDACRSLRYCGPIPPSDIQPFRSGWMGSGNSFEKAVGPTLSAYRAKYPDWNIEAVRGPERRRKNWGKPSYLYTGTFSVTAKWQGYLK